MYRFLQRTTSYDVDVCAGELEVFIFSIHSASAHQVVGDYLLHGENRTFVKSIDATKLTDPLSHKSTQLDWVGINTIKLAG